MKKRKSSSTASALAFLMAISVLASGCEKVDDSSVVIPTPEEIGVTTATEATDETMAVQETENAVPETETAETTVVTTVTEETEATTVQTEAPETKAAETAAPESTASSVTSASTSAAQAAAEWSETAKDATMYVTENCYSREKAVIGATPISQHYVGDSVEITAITDTGYYKLAEGGFIHSDYLSDTLPETTVVTTADEELIDDNTDNSSGDAPAQSTPGFYDPAVGNTGGEEITVSSKYNIKSSSRYAYKQLSAEEQTLYNNFVSSIKRLNSTVEVPSGMTKEQVKKVYTIVYDSEPQLFWMGSTISAGTAFATISFKTTDKAEIAAMQAEIDAAASNILSKANGYSGTVSKLKVMFDTIVLNSEFAKSEGGYNSTIYNGLTGKDNLQCAGYAKTIQYLCDLAGIECVVVRGTDSAGNSHAWNVVYCENGYYNLDATWGDPVNSFGSDYIQYEFFLVPDAWIHNITHFNVSKRNDTLLFTPPAATKEGCNYFAAYKKLYSGASEADAALKAEFDAAIAAGKNVVEIRVTDKSIYESMMSNDSFKAYQKYAKSKSSNVKQLQRQSSFTKGVYVVHYDIVYN